jgi:hypothetical protein
MNFPDWRSSLHATIARWMPTAGKPPTSTEAVRKRIVHGPSCLPSCVPGDQDALSNPGRTRGEWTYQDRPTGRQRHFFRKQRRHDLAFEPGVELPDDHEIDVTRVYSCLLAGKSPGRAPLAFDTVPRDGSLKLAMCYAREILFFVDQHRDHFVKGAIQNDLSLMWLSVFERRCRSQSNTSVKIRANSVKLRRYWIRQRKIAGRSHLPAWRLLLRVLFAEGSIQFILFDARRRIAALIEILLLGAIIHHAGMGDISLLFGFFRNRGFIRHANLTRPMYQMLDTVHVYVCAKMNNRPVEANPDQCAGTRLHAHERIDLVTC